MAYGLDFTGELVAGPRNDSVVFRQAKDFFAVGRDELTDDTVSRINLVARRFS